MLVVGCKGGPLNIASAADTGQGSLSVCGVTAGETGV